MSELHERLREKGWHEHHIQEVNRIIEEGKLHDRSGTSKYMSKVLYLISLLVLTICNLLVAVFLVPFLLVLDDAFLYIIIGTLGLIFGAFFSLLIWEIEHLEKKHHLLAALFMPAMAILSILIMVKVATRISRFLELDVIQSPITISIIYTITFLLPYAYVLIKKRE